jgi:hypothetical protein
VHDEQREALAATQERVAELEAQVGTLRETAATASRQTRELQALQKAQIRETTSMRERLLDMEVDTDERTTIGKLHRIILGLQTSENDAVRRIEEERQQRLETAARLLKVESQLDDKAETLRRVRTDAKMAHGHLRQKLNDTRRMFAGAITLEQQERQLAVLQTAREQKQKAREYFMIRFCSISPLFFCSGTLPDRAIVPCEGPRCDLTSSPSECGAPKLSGN